MPRKGRGGARQGTPGRSYPNRSDLQAPKPPLMTGRPYGERVATEKALSAVPAAPPAPTGGAGAPSTTPPPAGPAPGTLGGLLDPSVRPDEPLTAGLAAGPGPGPEVLQNHPDPDLDNLRAIYRMHPSEALRSLLESMGG